MRIIRNFFRFIGDSVSSMIKNPLMTIASMLIVTFCLFVFGVFIVLTMNANYMGQKMEEQCTASACVRVVLLSMLLLKKK